MKSGRGKVSKKSAAQISLTTLVMVTSALFITLRNMPMMAQTGLQMVIFNMIAAFAFLIPIALVSAELATSSPHHGGMYSWVKQAFGRHWGFLAVWLQWSQSMFGMASILAYVAASLAYVMNPAWADNRYFIFLIIVMVYWCATLANMRGTRISGIISSVCVNAGVFFPTVVLLILGVKYVLSGNTIHLNCSLETSNWLPSFSNSGNLVLLLSFIFGYVGVEVSASHANEVDNPRKNYPLAIFIAAIFGFFLTLFGGMIVAAVLPAEVIEKNLINGIMVTFSRLFELNGMAWLIPVFAGLVALGAAGQVSTWIVGPVKGLQATANRGDFPPIFRKSNREGIPVPLLVFQACVLTATGVVILLMPSVDLAFLMLTNLAVLLYAIAYALMFMAVIRLRYTKPNLARPYKIPGGMIGVWLVAGLGLLTASACFVIGFIPPAGQTFRQVMVVEVFMAFGVILLVAVPFLIMKYRPSRWHKGIITENNQATRPSRKVRNND